MTTNPATAAEVVLSEADREIVEARLIDTVFGNTTSIVFASTLGVLTAVFVAWTVSSMWMAGVAGLLVAAAVGRIVVHLGYDRDPDRLANARSWERRFSFAAWSFSALLGITGAAGLVLSDSPEVHMFLSVAIVGFVSMMASRNAGRPNIVGPQILLILVPMGVAFATIDHLTYYAMGGACIVHCISTLGLARSWKDKFKASFTNEIATLRLSEHVHVKNELFNTALSNMTRGFAILDDEGRFLETNARVFELTGTDRTVLGEGFLLSDLVRSAYDAGTLDHAARDAILASVCGAADHGRTEVGTSTGLHLEFARERGEDGRSVFTIEDVTSERAARVEIERRATRDELTGLWNRSHTLDHLESEFARLTDERTSGAVLFIDLDEFKEVNDVYGHSTGDKLLVSVAEILLASVRPGDHVGRMGGDEFLVFVPGTTDETEIASIAQRIVDRLSTPIQLEEWLVRIGATIGVAMIGGSERTVKDVVRNADIALYDQKGRQRGGVSFFQKKMQVDLELKKTLESQLRATLDRGGDQFSVFYQPIFDTTTRRVDGCEALIRWNHPVITNTSPQEFIPVAEETSLIVPIGKWVLRTACAEAASWTNRIYVSVNLSPVQFIYGDIVATVRDVLEETGLEPGRLMLEFTETVLAKDASRVKQVIEELRAMGIRFALDDFGTGYSSIKYVRDFKFDKIKIDKSFIDHVDVDPLSAALVRLVTGIAEVANLTVVAEGIEKEEQLAAIRDMGVTAGQGYLFSRPLPVEAFRRNHGNAASPLRVVQAA